MTQHDTAETITTETAIATAIDAGREAASQGGTNAHLCFDVEMYYDQPDWIEVLGEAALEHYTGAFMAQLADGASIEHCSQGDLCGQLQYEHRASDGDSCYLVWLERTNNEPPIRLLWSPCNNRAGLSWGADADWTDATSPEDAVRRYLTGDMTL